MKHWQEDQLQALQSVKCEDELFQAITNLAKRLGFEHCAYGLRAPLPLKEPKILMFNNYPLEWQKLYGERNYLAIDPTVKHGIASPLPLIWSDDIFSSSPEFWEEARSFDLRYGWAQSIYSKNGVGGMTTFARSTEALTFAEMQAKGFEMGWLAQVIHLGMSRCLLPKIMPEVVDVMLSNRELAVLRWTAEGKTSSEISEIIHISERTVNFHIRNAVVKLNASNKTSATIRAAMLGLL